MPEGYAFLDSKATAREGPYREDSRRDYSIARSWRGSLAGMKRPRMVPIAQLMDEQRFRSPAIVNEAARAMAKWGNAPPILVRMRGGKMVIYDGHHRVSAARALGVKMVPVLDVDQLSADDILNYHLHMKAYHAKFR